MFWTTKIKKKQNPPGLEYKSCSGGHTKKKKKSRSNPNSSWHRCRRAHIDLILFPSSSSISSVEPNKKKKKTCTNSFSRIALQIIQQTTNYEENTVY